MASQDSFSTEFPDNRSAADVFGVSEELRGDLDAELDERCAQIIDHLIGAARGKDVLKLLSADVVAGVNGLAQAVRDQDPDFEALVNAVADVAKLPSGFFEGGEVGDSSSRAETPWGGMRRKRGGGLEQEVIDNAAGEAEPVVNDVADMVQGGNEGQALEQAAVRIAGPAAVAIQGAAENSTLASMGQVNHVISVASQSLAGGLSCLAGAAETTSRAVIRAIRGGATAAGDSVYQVRQRVASFTAGMVVLGTWAAGYWGPDNVARSTCMTVLTPFMTRYGAGPWCGVEVQPQGMFHAAQQFAANLAPVGELWTALGIFGTATTERYDIAARAIFATVTALVVIGFGSWSGFIGVIGRPTRRAAARALGGLNLFFTGKASAEDALEVQLQSTYEMLANAWETPGDVGAEGNFQACLAIAVALGADPAGLEQGVSIFEHFGDVAAELDSPTFNPSDLGFNFGGGEDAAPTHTSARMPNGPQVVGHMRRFLTMTAVAEAITNLPPPAAAIGGGARRKYMQLRSLLQLAAVTAGALERAREKPAAMDAATQKALQEALQQTMVTYRDTQINSLLAAEDLVVAFAANVSNVLRPPGQGGGRRRRRTRRSKPRSRARRKGNKKKTRVGKRRRTRRH